MDRFNDYSLTEKEVLKIYTNNYWLIRKYAYINNLFNEDLMQDFFMTIFISLTKNKKIKKK